MLVGRVRADLHAGWYLMHDIVPDRARGNYDHIVVGPPGVFVINTKNHGEQPVIIDGDMYTERHRGGHVEQGSGRRVGCQPP